MVGDGRLLTLLARVDRLEMRGGQRVEGISGLLTGDEAARK